MILRAQTEWHFNVLSEKLAQNYRSELAEIEDRIERAGLQQRPSGTRPRTSGKRVQSQLQDKTLMREQRQRATQSVRMPYLPS